MTARDEVETFMSTGVGDLFRWVVGGVHPSLIKHLTERDIQEVIEQLTSIVHDGGGVEDYLEVRVHLKRSLIRRGAGRPVAS